MSVIQYGVDPRIEYQLNAYSNKQDMIDAAKGIQQMYGTSTNTFKAITFARLVWQEHSFLLKIDVQSVF